MRYYSLNRKAPKTSFEDAVIRGLAPDRGLYFPEEIRPLPREILDQVDTLDKVELAHQVIAPFIGDEIPPAHLYSIIAETIDFEFPLVSLTPRINSLELFHGPTLAFKDVGARFMARCLGYFIQQQATSQEVTVLVATSGDTGGAVASGFYEVPGIRVVILYPSGKVSTIQEKQLTTYGKNVTALEVMGTFDDCQAMVKKAFLDEQITSEQKLTSANSINIARWLPQMFYYFLSYQQVRKTKDKLVYSVPSGNFGNICAGMMAQQMGLPITTFVTGTNANNVVPAYLQSGDYQPQASVSTISNAMDVGDPSNFVRILEIYGNNFQQVKDNLTGFSYSDEATSLAMKELYQKFQYMADPHGAIGYLALQEFLKANEDYQGVFLETAHPVKFLDVIPKQISEKIILPEAIKQLLTKPKQAELIADYSELKSFLLAQT